MEDVQEDSTADGLDSSRNSPENDAVDPAVVALLQKRASLDESRKSITAPDPAVSISISPPSSKLPESLGQSKSSSDASTVFGIILVGFDHAIGPVNEFAYPPELLENVELQKSLPFLSLPDGSHTKEEDYSYFHLLNSEISDSTIFGISCNRQISSASLANKGIEVTRSTVQKAIVVLASKPIFGPLRDKLGLITRAFFAQKDFSDKSILVELFDSLKKTNGNGVEGENRNADDEAKMYMGTSLRELVYKFRFKTLILLKLILLQRKVMFFAANTTVESLCTFQYSLIALIPALLTHLDDAASPLLDDHAKTITRPSSLRTSDKNSLIQYLGLPLNIFGKGAFFQPYLPLQQIDMLKTKTNSFVVGVTNSIFFAQKDCQIDVIVNIDEANVQILDQELVALLKLSAADRKWMDEIVTTVESTWDPADPTRPTGMSFLGSDDFLRAKFEEYICSMLSCIKFTTFLAKKDRSSILLSGKEVESAASHKDSFGNAFVNAFRLTPAYQSWNLNTDEVIFDVVEPRHPMEGKTNALEDVGIRFTAGLHDLKLEENLAPAAQIISTSIARGSDSIWKAVAAVQKRQKDFAESRGGETLPPALTSSVIAGIDVAKVQASNLAAGFGSFSRTLFAPRPSPPLPDPSTFTKSRTSSTFDTFFKPIATSIPSRPLSLSAHSTTRSVSVPLSSGWTFPSFRRSVSSDSKLVLEKEEDIEEIGIIKDLDAIYGTNLNSPSENGGEIVRTEDLKEVAL